MPPKYVRRPLSLSVLVVAMALLVLALPLWLPCAIVADLLTSPKRMRYSRLGFVLLLLGVNELRTVGHATALWVRSGFGRTVFRPTGQLRMQRVLRRYANGLIDSTVRALGVRFEIEGLDDVIRDGGPFLVFGHHTSLLDSALPAKLFGAKGFGLRYVIKSTLAYAPAFDIGGHLLPIHFVDRSGSRTAREMDHIRDLAAAMQGEEAFVLFPEGGFYNPARLDRAVERLRTDAPHLVERAAHLRHTLPPRGGGALAMLEGAPDADVVILAHTGLERFNSLGSIVRNVPLRAPVRVQLWRIRRADVPIDASARYDWLFEQFERIDRFAIEQLDGAVPVAA